MLDPIKQKLVDELIAHLEDSQGGDLANLMEESRNPKPTEGHGDMDPAKAIEDATQDGDENASAHLAPAGVKIDKVSIMKDKSKMDGDEAGEDPAEEASESPEEESKEDDMSDEELEELLKKYL